MSLDLVTVTADNITWSVNENWRRVFDELQWKVPDGGRIKLQGDWDFVDAYQVTGVVSAGPGSAVPSTEDSDPYRELVVMLLHFNGTQGSTTFVDELGHTPTVTGSRSAISTFQPLQGSGCYYNPTSTSGGGAEGLRFSNLNEAVVAEDGLTVEAWVRTATAGQSETYFELRCQPSSRRLRCNVSSGNIQGLSTVVLFDSVPAVLNQWTHVAFTLTGTLSRFFVNGVYLGTISTGNQITTIDQLSIGCRSSGETVQQLLTGAVDEVRVTLYNRYPGTANFTPPTAPFPNP